jgi:outer membrane protein
VKLVKQSLLLVCALIFAGQVAAEGKVAVISLQQAILNTDEAKERIKLLQESSDYKEHKTRAESLKKDGETLIAELQKNRDVMSAEQQETQAKKINSIKTDLDFQVKRLQQFEGELQQTLVREMGPRVQGVIGELIKVEGIGLLLRAEAALHADSAYNITAKVTDKLNQAQQ